MSANRSTSLDVNQSPAARARSRRLASRSRNVGPRESVIQATLVRLLNMTAHIDVVWFHVPNGGSRHKVEAARLRGQGVVAGVPDLVLLRGGRVYGLELKASDGKLSSSQKLMHARWAATGSNIAVAYSIDEAMRQLSAWGLVKLVGLHRQNE
jgi:hypothetical protein